MLVLWNGKTSRMFARGTGNATKKSKFGFLDLPNCSNRLDALLALIQRSSSPEWIGYPVAEDARSSETAHADRDGCESQPAEAPNGRTLRFGRRAGWSGGHLLGAEDGRPGRLQGFARY